MFVKNQLSFTTLLVYANECVLIVILKWIFTWRRKK